MQSRNIQDVSGPNRSQSSHSDDQLQAESRPSRAGRGQKKRLKWIVGAVVVVLLLAGAFWWCKDNLFNSQIDGSKYQAVFLSNGQVYFGKLHGYGSAQPYLTSVYYIQSPSGTTTNTQTATDQQLQLVKLGGEVHGPENEMILSKDAIIFVENLTNDSKVVKVINGKQ